MITASGTGDPVDLPIVERRSHDDFAIYRWGRDGDTITMMIYCWSFSARFIESLKMTKSLDGGAIFGESGRIRP